MATANPKDQQREAIDRFVKREDEAEDAEQERPPYWRKRPDRKK